MFLSLHPLCSHNYSLCCSLSGLKLICDLLDQLINHFSFYNGPIRQSYQIYSQEDFAVRWAQYLYHLQGGSTEPPHIFSCLSTIDSTHIDPLLLLTAALILQACQHCPLVLAGYLSRESLLHRVDSTQMPHNLTVKVMVHETETYNQITRPDGLSSSSSSGRTLLFSAETSTTVFLTATELQYLRSSSVYRASRYFTPLRKKPTSILHCRNTFLCNTLFGYPSFDTPGPLSPSPIKVAPETSHHTLSNGKLSHEVEEGVTGGSYNHKGKSMQNNDRRHVNGQNGGSIALGGENSAAHRFSGEESQEPGSQRMENPGDKAFRVKERQGTGCLPPASPLPCENSTDAPLLPTALYQHRVRGLVLALLRHCSHRGSVSQKPGIFEGTGSTSEDYCSGGLWPLGTLHTDCIQNMLTSNLSGRPGGAQDRSFVRATSLLHSHFSHTEALQEAIVRSAGAAVYGTRSVAQETYFLQQGGAVRNSGIPDHQDNAFSLPSKARHRLLKHRVNLL
ncbi:unnamed protein product [Oncorhynchus mykiss]|uniref:CCZ1/INTU/HPS4 third Longin domain-containing protein n=1 Tax=Oncorhynchus mykiss TaxID=8022 RepID=A0A060WLY9_ONCMY|nr:unnamed protein product [Oncorhynchus mykiss]